MSILWPPIRALPQTCLNGNIKPLSFVEDTPEEIADQSSQLLRLFADRGGFILSSGCGIPPESKPENIAAMVLAARRGKQLVPTLTVKLEAGERRISFVPGRSLRHILDDADVGVRSGCRGTGACGLCLVRVEAGQVGEPALNERIHLDDAQRARGVRLACQVRLQHDLQLAILSPAPKSAWRRLDGQEKRRVERPPVLPRGDPSWPVEKPYGAAVDLGTTHIRLSLRNLASGCWLAERWGLNPQMIAGSDVMTRLVAAAESPAQARAASQQTVEAIGEALWDIAVRGD